MKPEQTLFILLTKYNYLFAWLLYSCFLTCVHPILKETSFNLNSFPKRDLSEYELVEVASRHFTAWSNSQLTIEVSLIPFNRLSNLTGYQNTMLGWFCCLIFGIIPCFAYISIVLLLEWFYTLVHIEWIQCGLITHAIWQLSNVTAWWIDFGKIWNNSIKNWTTFILKREGLDCLLWKDITVDQMLNQDYCPEVLLDF